MFLTESGSTIEYEQNVVPRRSGRTRKPPDMLNLVHRVSNAAIEVLSDLIEIKESMDAILKLGAPVASVEYQIKFAISSIGHICAYLIQQAGVYV